VRAAALDGGERGGVGEWSGLEVGVLFVHACCAFVLQQAEQHGPFCSSHRRHHNHHPNNNVNS